MTRRSFVLSTAVAAAGRPLAAAVAPPAPYGALPSARQLRWHELEVYSFLHFTVNTFTDREWGNGDEDPSIFNPTEFNADTIVTALKEGIEDVYPGDVAQEWLERWRENPKVLERELSAGG